MPGTAAHCRDDRGVASLDHGSLGRGGLPAGASASAGCGLTARARPLRHGCARASHTPTAASRTAHSAQPRAVVPTPTYFRPEAKITKVMTGLMYRSGAREDRKEPTRTAGTLPITIDAVTANSTWPNASAPSAAASVSGTASRRSVPTSWLAASVGDPHSSSTLISEPEPTEVIPTITPPTTPITTVRSRRQATAPT